LTAGILALAAVAMPSAGFPQSGADLAADAPQAIVEAIEREQSQNGIYSEALISPLAGLALFYNENGNEALAAGAIERIRQIVRAHYGLYSLEQAPLIQRLIAYEQGSGNPERALGLEQELLTLARRHPDDLRTVPILRQIAVDRMTRYRNLGAYLGMYEEAIDVFHRNDAYSSPELRQLEMLLIYNGGCDLGRQSYRRLTQYDRENSKPLLDRVATLVESADFELVCSQTRHSFRGSAQEKYRQAYELLLREGAAQPSIDRFFSPEDPVRLPTYGYSPLPSAKTEAPGEHIDIAFQILSSGQPRNVDIVHVETSAADAVKWVKWDIVALIKRTVFRPRMTNGQFDEDARVVVRFALSCVPSPSTPGDCVLVLRSR
jgi:tetratricopeptide (TPR) repeat protein